MLQSVPSATNLQVFHVTPGWVPWFRHIVKPTGNGKPCMRCALAKGTTPLRDLSLKAVEVFGILGFLCRSRPRPQIHTSPLSSLIPMEPFFTEQQLCQFGKANQASLANCELHAQPPPVTILTLCCSCTSPLLDLRTQLQ